MLVLPANHHVVGCRAHVRNQNRVDRAAIEELVGARRHIRHNQEELRDTGAHENRYHRGVVLVRLGKRQREGSLARCLERRLGCNDDIAQHRADQRENNAKVYDGSANRTDCQGGRCELRHLLARHNAKRQHRDNQIQREHSRKSKRRRATYVAHILCTARDDDGTLDAREDPNKGNHGRDNLLAKARTRRLSPEVVHKDIDVELTQEHNAQHKESQRHQLRQGDDRVNARGLLDATKHKSGKEP